eukprot:6491028-Amphidinium_carterae.2
MMRNGILSHTSPTLYFRIAEDVSIELLPDTDAMSEVGINTIDLHGILGHTTLCREIPSQEPLSSENMEHLVLDHSIAMYNEGALNWHVNYYSWMAVSGTASMSGACMRWLKKNNLILNEIVGELYLESGEARCEYIDTGVERNASWSMFLKGARSTMHAVDEPETEEKVSLKRTRNGVNINVSIGVLRKAEATLVV